MTSLAESVRHDIQHYGWSVINVGDDEPPFGYTVGLWETLRQPELIVFGLPTPVMHSFLNFLGEEAKKGLNLAVPQFVPGVGSRFGVQLKPLHEANLARYFGFALGFYEEPFPATQVLWPDKSGRFPNDRGYSKKLLGIQPRLKYLTGAQ
jgi:hypothetical protein